MSTPMTAAVVGNTGNAGACARRDTPGVPGYPLTLAAEDDREHMRYAARRRGDGRGVPDQPFAAGSVSAMNPVEIALVDALDRDDQDRRRGVGMHLLHSGADALGERSRGS